MTKITLLICICLCTIELVCGQAIKLGVFAGPNLSTIGSQNATGETAALGFGFHAGLFTEITAGNWSIVPSVVYADIGGNINIVPAPPDGGDGNETVSLQYLQLPLNLVYNTTGRKFFFGGGQYIGFGLSGSINGNISGGAFSGNTTETVNEKFTFNSNSTPDYGINLLAGVHLDGGTIFTIGCGLGLRQGSDSNTLALVRNDVISISIGHSIL